MIELEILPVPSVEMEVSEPNTVEMSLGNATIIGDKDHTHLINRDASDQHPISAITDLQSELDSKIESVKTIDGVELEGTGNIVTRYDFTQAVASDTWSITHNLGKYPSVSVSDTGGNIVVGDVQYVDVNSLTIRFASAFSGNAYLN